LQREVRLQQVVKLVGPDALPDSQRFILDVCSLYKTAFLQQNAFDEVDRYTTASKQAAMTHLILTYWRRGSAALRRGVTLVKLRRIRVYQDMLRMKSEVPNENLEPIEKLTVRLERAIDQLESIYV
jgi:V/A-type H+-transporting ATPase subunit A